MLQVSKAFSNHVYNHGRHRVWVLMFPHAEGLRGTRLVVQSLCDLGLMGRGPL